MLLLNQESKNRILGLIYRQAILYVRHMNRRFDLFLWPTIDAILFGAIGKYAAHQGSASTLALILAGFVMAQLVWQSHINLSVFFVQETWDWNVLYMMTRPISALEMIIAATTLTIGAATIAVSFISVTIALSFGLNLTAVPLGAIFLLPILMLLGWSTALFASSLVVRLGQKADNFIWAMFGIIGPMSGSIVPVDNLPSWMRDIAVWLPTTHAYEAGRKLLFGHGFPAGDLAFAACGAVVMYGLAALALTRSMTIFRQKGYVSRYV